MAGHTLYRKIWDNHVIANLGDATARLWIDRILLYEGTSFLAFRDLAKRGLPVRRPHSALAVPDHLLPTQAEQRAALGGRERQMVDALRDNCAAHGIAHIGLDDPRQGIVHVVGPEQGFTLPGSTLVCADSHTSTHGAFGALAFGVGTTDLTLILATQTWVQRPSRTMRIWLEGAPGPGAGGKDLALAIIRAVGAGGGGGHVLEFAGAAIDSLSMEGRMTLCNMAVEAGARSGLIAPDETTFEWLRGRPMAPAGAHFDEAVHTWKTLRSDRDAVFDREIVVDVNNLAPHVTWGTSPEHAVTIAERVPDPRDAPNELIAAAWRRALDYMDLQAGAALSNLPITRAFIGSCTNSRLSDLRAAAAIAQQGKVAPGVKAMVVPGSGTVRREAEAEGLHEIFLSAGFEWRLPGCSMCFGSAFDSVSAGERCASTSNRNFEHRQGQGARTHLMNPAMAAAAAISGCLTDIRGMI